MLPSRRRYQHPPAVMQSSPGQVRAIVQVFRPNRRMTASWAFVTLPMSELQRRACHCSLIFLLHRGQSPVSSNGTGLRPRRRGAGAVAHQLHKLNWAAIQRSPRTLCTRTSKLECRQSVPRHATGMRVLQLRVKSQRAVRVKVLGLASTRQVVHSLGHCLPPCNFVERQRAIAPGIIQLALEQ